MDLAVGWRRRSLLVFTFVALGVAAFGPAISAPFDFDDGEAILENASIRRLWPLTTPLRPPPRGTAVSGRPVANVSFAVNYALNRWIGVPQTPATEQRRQTVGYHVVNILLHVIAGLLLFGVIRHTIRFGRVPENWRDSADRVAIFVAAIWLIHPLQTEAVDYVSQRTELLVSVCYLGTLYAAMRAWNAGLATTEAQSRRESVLAWSVVAVITSLLGMGSKEVMITAPIMVMLYDRAFLSDDWRTLWRVPARRALYAALLATCGFSIALITAGARSSTVGFSTGITWYQYLYSQAWAISHYLKLFVWPDDLRFDYGRAPVAGLAGLPGLVGLSAAAVASLIAWRIPRWRWLGFLGAWFFLLLAPSSSIVPIRTEIAAERRVYLALAAVVVLVVIGAEHFRHRAVGVRRSEIGAVLVAGVIYFAASGWTAHHLAADSALAWIGLQIAIGLVAAISVWLVLFSGRRLIRGVVLAAIGAAMIVTSARRSALYVDLERRWQDAVEKTPTNGRAYDNLASAELRANPPRIAKADSVLHVAMAVDPAFVPAWVRSATIARAQGRLDDARSLLERALQLHPGDAAATKTLGEVLVAQKRPDLALPYLRQFAAFAPSGESMTAVAVAYLGLRQLDSAVALLERAARLDSTRVDARRYLAATLIELERGPEAIPYAEQAIRLDSTSAVTLGLMSLSYAQAGRADDASRAAERAVARAPDNPTVLVFVGRAMQTVGRYTDAADYLIRAVRLTPNDPQALTRLGMVEGSLGNKALAKRLFDRVLNGMPDYEPARRALAELGRAGAAR